DHDLGDWYFELNLARAVEIDLLLPTPSELVGAGRGGQYRQQDCWKNAFHLCFSSSGTDR
ncbi:MAG: hypothetical protein K8H90_01435, partial [Thermoanaerobaculia bacterium]|nr:hypothetical protein [Thermoanaerobaculia bacterium]